MDEQVLAYVRHYSVLTSFKKIIGTKICIISRPVESRRGMIASELTGRGKMEIITYRKEYNLSKDLKYFRQGRNN